VRWAGKLGYIQQTEVKPGIWEDVVTEESATGYLENVTEAVSTGSRVLPEYRTTTTVSVISNGQRVPGRVLRYVTVWGVRMEIASLVHEPPRVSLYIGEEYHGPLPTGAS
jgi:hypothetical protein